MTYSLADYIVSVTKIISEAQLTELKFGGNGSMMESITVDRPKETFTTEGDDTGGYVHNKSYNKTGTVTLTLNQLSKQVGRLKTLCNIYARPNVDISEGLTLTVTDSQGNIIATCNDCMPQGIPTQTLGSSAATQSWVFTCGVIEFN